jgi:DNA-binding MarR family transcriptional regulator
MTDNATQQMTPPIPTPETIAAMRRRPRFRQAAAAIAADSVEYYQGRWLANRVLNDRARFVMAAVMLFLHYSWRADVANSGLTAARLREICVRVGLCSSGRVEATLLMMRASGYIERVESTSDRRVRRYVPTAKFLDLHRERHRRVFSAIDLLRGDTAYAAGICGGNDDASYRRFMLAMGYGYLAGYRIVDAAPVLQNIIDRDVGLPLMLCVLLSSPGYAEFAPEKFRTTSVAGLARRFNVSRVHVRLVLRDSAAAGLVLRDDDTAQVTALPALSDALESFFASAFLFAGACAEIALTEAA